MSGNDDGQFQVGWFRGGLPAHRQASPSRIQAAIEWARSMRGKPYQGLVEPTPVEPRLPGHHVLIARRGCGCIMVHCPNEPEAVTLPGPRCAGDVHDTSPEHATSNEAPVSVGSSAAPSNTSGPHDPIGLKPTDVGLFICCACGKNPTPKHWLEDHWPGDPVEGERLVREMHARELARQNETERVAEYDDYPRQPE